MYQQNKLIDYFDSLVDAETWISEFGAGVFYLYTYIPYNWGWEGRKHRHPLGKLIAILRCK